MVNEVTRHKIVPVVLLDDAAHAVPLARALAAGGLPLLELTLRTDAALEGIRRIRSECPELLVGAGTVLSPAQVRQAEAAGAQFALSPGLTPGVVQEASERGLFFIPGVMTPSDVEGALNLGCGLMKFFPAVPSGGLPMLQSLAAPFLHVGAQFIPLGGVSTQNMRAFLDLQGVPAIGGSWLCERRLIRDERWDEITALAAEAVRIASENKAP